MPSSSDIRNTFIKYFTNKGHTYVPSSSIIPENDDSILFVNSGMCQFKDIFLEKKEPEFETVCNYQKCLRLSGKHNDLEVIGVDTYHHTFFEMLGTWSFGKYYKEQTIAYAWDLLVNIYKIDKDRLYVTYFNGDIDLNLLPDIETKLIWEKYLPKSRVLPFNMKDNFWEMSDTGPCGPCTEIHYSYLEGDQGYKVNRDDPNVIEIWNMVFMEYNRINGNTFVPLSTKFVDTGMGFERLVAILQDKTSNYDTDIFSPIMEKICEYSNKLEDKRIESYYLTQDEELKKVYRIIADHIRCLIIALDDGILFGNTSREYVIRKIYRRMSYYTSHVLGVKDMDISLMLYMIIQEPHPEIIKYLKHQNDYFTDILNEESNKFDIVLKKGIKLIDKIIKKNNNFTGEDMGKLYETYGFPPILTKEICNSKGIIINTKDFESYMQKHKKKSTK
jgi:alanyl-tRNA synthetase